MTESVIFNSAELTVGFCIALFFCLIDLKTHSTGYVFPIISVLICLATSIAALLYGATAYELSTVILIFLALNLTVFIVKKGGDDK